MISDVHLAHTDLINIQSIINYHCPHIHRYGITFPPYLCVWKVQIASMNMKKSFLLLCGCLAIASACCNQPAKTAGINYAYMDTTARPGDDFAKYATGH